MSVFTEFETWVMEQTLSHPLSYTGSPGPEFEAAKRQWRWDLDFLCLARFWANLKSKDPSTQVGAVLVDKDLVPVSMGYNGFPRGVDDSPERLNDRETKYKFVQHAERNALDFAERRHVDTTLYVWPLFSCHECAKSAVSKRVKRVVTPPPTVARWQESQALAREIYTEAGVRVEFVPHDCINTRFGEGTFK